MTEWLSLDEVKKFEIDNIYLILQKENDIIEFIESKYKSSIPSISNKLCGVLKCYEVLNLESNLLIERIKHYQILLTLKQDVDKENLLDKKTIEEGQKMMTHCSNEMNKLADTIKSDINLLNRQDITVQLYCVLKIYLEICNLRGNEIINMIIKDTDTDEKINYINVTTKQIIINTHKTDKSQGKRTIDIESPKLINIFKKDWVNI